MFLMYESTYASWFFITSIVSSSKSIISSIDTGQITSSCSGYRSTSNIKRNLACLDQIGRGGSYSQNTTSDIQNLLTEHSERVRLNSTISHHLDNSQTHISSSENRRRNPKTVNKKSTQRIESSSKDYINTAQSYPTKKQSLYKTNDHKKKKSRTILRQGDRYNECLRRIRREWKDAVQLGIAYDWINRETVTPLGRSPSGRTGDRHSSSKNHGNATHKAQLLRNSKEEDDGTTFFKYNYIRIGPMGKNLLQWHFSVLGPANSVYEKGIYHGVILLPKDYPGSPPRVQLLTPSGRFITKSDICLSASAHHPESWTPRWTILSLVDALRIHMLTTPNEIGGMHASSEARREYAKLSRSWPLHRYMLSVGIFSSSSEMESDNIYTSDLFLNQRGSAITSRQKHVATITTWRRATLRVMSLLTAFIFLFLIRWM